MDNTALKLQSNSTQERQQQQVNQQNHPTVHEEHKVIIPNFHGEKLVGVLHATGSKELVVVCHGFRSSKDRIPMVNLASAIRNIGISVFRFDFAGNGESEGSFQYGNYYREVEDLRAVIQHFRGKKHTVGAIIGHSKGGNVVLLYASNYQDICAVINISGRFDLKRGIEGRLGKDFLERIKYKGFIDVKNRKGEFVYRVTEESLMDRLNTDAGAACQLISKDCRVLTIHGDMDQIVPIEDALEFVKIIRNHSLQIIQGADHEYTSYQGELVSVVLLFLRTRVSRGKYIRNQPSSLGGGDSSSHSRL